MKKQQLQAVLDTARAGSEHGDSGFWRHKVGSQGQGAEPHLAAACPANDWFNHSL